MKDLLKLGNEMCSCTKLRANEWTRKRNNLEMQQLVETGTYDCLTDAIQGSYRPIDETVNAKTELVNLTTFSWRIYPQPCVLATLLSARPLLLNNMFYSKFDPGMIRACGWEVNIRQPIFFCTRNNEQLRIRAVCGKQV